MVFNYIKNIYNIYIYIVSFLKLEYNLEYNFVLCTVNNNNVKYPLIKEILREKDSGIYQFSSSDNSNNTSYSSYSPYSPPCGGNSLLNDSFYENKYVKDIMLDINLINELNIFISKLDYSNITKENVKRSFIIYELSRRYKLNNFNIFNKDILLIDDQYYYNHLIGFIEGDGCFTISKRLDRPSSKYYFGPKFAIGLNIDDIGYLEYLKEKVKFINKITVRKMNKKETSKFNAFIEFHRPDIPKILSIIDSNNGLLSIKSIDYSILKLFIHYYENNNDSQYKDQLINYLTYTEMSNNKEFKKYLRLDVNIILSKLTIPHLIGFLEADGCFLIKNNNRIQLEIDQHNINIDYMKAIKLFIINLPLDSNNLSVRVKKSSDKIYTTRNDKVRIELGNTLELYYKIYPMLINNPLLTRKFYDMILSFFALILLKHNILSINECNVLYNKIRTINNSARYGTNNTNLIPLMEILVIFNKYINK